MAQLTEQDKLNRVSLTIVEYYNYHPHQFMMKLWPELELKGLTQLEIENGCIVYSRLTDNNHLQITVSLIIWKKE